MKNAIVIIISFILCIILFITELSYLTLYNIDKGITKNEVTKIIDNIDIRKELNNIENKKNIEFEYIDEKLEKEVENYIKENIKAMWLNSFYNENINYISSNEFKIIVNNKLDELLGENKITEKEQEIIKQETEDITKEIDEMIKQVTQDERVYIGRKIISKETRIYVLIGIILISIIIILINKSKETLIWLSVPTLMTGVIFVLLSIILTGKSNIIDINIFGTINPYLKNLTETITQSSKTTIIIGLIEISIYIILKYKESSEQNGKI
jgi:hypothetical protein